MEAYGPPKSEFALMGDLLHGRVLSNEERFRRGMTLNPHRQHCPFEIEDSDHILRKVQQDQDPLASPLRLKDLETVATSTIQGMGCLECSKKGPPGERR